MVADAKAFVAPLNTTKAAGRGGPFERFASGLSSPGCMLETTTWMLEFYALMARRAPALAGKRRPPGRARPVA